MKQIIFYTTHKAGSMFVFRLLRKLSNMKKIDFYSPNLAHDSPNNILNESCKIDASKQLCICPLRIYSEFPKVLNADIMLQLRDPRDVLVSLFYSVAYSHLLKSKTGRGPTDKRRKDTLEKGINRFVIDNSAELKKRYEIYITELLPKKVILLKYEDMVTNFKEWIIPIAQEFNLTIEEKNKIIDQYTDEFIPKKEDKYAHKRKMTPGDYKDKLKPETIEELNTTFKDVLQKLNYN